MFLTKAKAPSKSATPSGIKQHRAPKATKAVGCFKPMTVSTQKTVAPSVAVRSFAVGGKAAPVGAAKAKAGFPPKMADPMNDMRKYLEKEEDDHHAPEKSEVREDEAKAVHTSSVEIGWQVTMKKDKVVLTKSTPVFQLEVDVDPRQEIDEQGWDEYQKEVSENGEQPDEEEMVEFMMTGFKVSIRNHDVPAKAVDYHCVLKGRRIGIHSISIKKGDAKPEDEPLCMQNAMHFDEETSKFHHEFLRNIGVNDEFAVLMMRAVPLWEDKNFQAYIDGMKEIFQV